MQLNVSRAGALWNEFNGGGGVGKFWENCLFLILRVLDTIVIENDSLIECNINFLKKIFRLNVLYQLKFENSPNALTFYTLWNTTLPAHNLKQL